MTQIQTSETQYQVKTKGFKQLYTSFEEAKKDYEKIKRKLKKENVAFKIEIFAVAKNGDLRLLENTVITENSLLLND